MFHSLEPRRLECDAAFDANPISFVPFQTKTPEPMATPPPSNTKSDVDGLAKEEPSTNEEPAKRSPRDDGRTGRDSAAEKDAPPAAKARKNKKKDKKKSKKKSCCPS